jgi:predicted glycoside hydrolase/deacetylase ChbG (UPF0249 family)
VALTKGRTNRLLGYPEDARLLILNADDFGMCHAINMAIIEALYQGIARSTTLMVPCPWALHALHFLTEHPEISFGIHLTVISDWVDYRWGPITSKEKVPSLIDQSGYFYNFEHMPGFLAQVELGQLAEEFNAQIETVLASGLRPTHLDWHSLRIGGRADIFEVMLGLAKEYGLALRVVGRTWIESLQNQGFPTNDYDFLDSYQLDPVDKPSRYRQLLRELPEGLSEWAVHPGFENGELLAIEKDSKHVRQSDYEFLMSEDAKDLIEEEGIILLDYRDLQTVWNEVTAAQPSS